MMIDTSPAPLLLLGRLDGRLRHSPARDIWIARSRLSGVATIAKLAGVPIGVDDMLNWICGRTPPPRRDEGLNDPLSIAALFHFALLAQEDDADPLTSSTLKVLRSVLDDRAEAETWAGEDLIRFGTAFRAASRGMLGPYRSPTLLAVAERLLDVQGALSVASAGGRTVTSVDGRQLSFEPTYAGTVWLLACHLPRALVAAGLTDNFIPALVGIPRYLTSGAADIANEVESFIGRICREGLAELDRLEDRLAALPAEMNVTRRSRLPEFMRLKLAYPGVRVPAIARLLGVSSQAASKLAARANTLGV